MGIDTVKPKSAPSVPKTVEAKPVISTVPLDTAPALAGKKPSEGFDILKKKLMSVSGRYTAPTVADSGRADLKDLIGKQRSAVYAGTVPPRSNTSDASAAKAMKDLGAANTRAGSISGEEMTAAILSGIKDKDRNGAAGEYKEIAKWVKDNAKLLSPDAKASFAAYEKLARAAQEKGHSGIDAARFQAAVSKTAAKVADEPSLGSKAPAKVGEFIDEVIKNHAKGKPTDEDNLKPEFTAIKEGLMKGDYEAAHKAFLKAESSKDMSSDLDGRQKPLGQQLALLADMQALGVKDITYPPGEKQLLEYFGKMKDDPAKARQAFEDYTAAFHVHPGATADIKYGGREGLGGPNNFDELGGRDAKDQVDHMGKQMNDCEGYGYMAEKLLGAANFKVEKHLTVDSGTEMGGHSMVQFTHKKDPGNVTITSNDWISSAKAKDATALAKEGFRYATGERKNWEGEVYEEGTATGKEKMYSGKTMKASQEEWVKHLPKD